MLWQATMTKGCSQELRMEDAIIKGCAPEEPGQEALLGVVVHELQPGVGAYVRHHGVKGRRAGAQEHEAAPAGCRNAVSSHSALSQYAAFGQG